MHTLVGRGLDVTELKQDYAQASPGKSNPTQTCWIPPKQLAESKADSGAARKFPTATQTATEPSPVCGRTRPTFDRMRLNSKPIWPIPGQVWSSLVVFGPNSVALRDNVCRTRADFGRVRVKFGRARVNVERLRATVGRIWTTLGPMLSNLVEVGPTSIELRKNSRCRSNCGPNEPNLLRHTAPFRPNSTRSRPKVGGLDRRGTRLGLQPSTS